ncbi:hypothetical protein F5972_03830 [Microbispora cellulosiformans]|uniref:DUF4386 family protein n=1 Tax=Microbispora cellulosiformans TaxID=2614688 RepID=A0A5J5KD79_9ACTN|nr:hypothetical protein [Microbispora cellulosiformans]KAA9381949.1 hypothetical protein F5972_03830 [Microbispora cellulosiformans]
MTSTSHVPGATAPTASSAAAPAKGLSESTVRRLALGLSTGALTWSAVSFVYGFDVAGDPGLMITDLAGLAFQIGAQCLLTIMLRTGATGVSRVARGMVQAERVLMSLAMVWSLVHGLFPAARDTVWLGILDAFWPLSMLGMFVLGVKIAITGRWRGAARLWPLVAESWVVVTLPTLAIFGTPVSDVVGAAHLLVGYTTLGLILAFRPDLVRGGK